jgi:phosphoribosylformylglycinamidine synthase II
MAFRIEIHPKTDPKGHHAPKSDPRGHALLARLKDRFPIQDVHQVDIYTVDGQFNDEDKHTIASALTNPVTQKPVIVDGAQLNKQSPSFDWALEIGFLPGVTDNVATTAQEIIEDTLDRKLGNNEGVYSSNLYLLNGTLGQTTVEKIAAELANPLIQRIHIVSAEDYTAQGGMPTVVPRVQLHADDHAISIDLTSVSDDELTEIAQKGIADADGSRRGPLGLSLDYMKAIRDHFRDVEQRPIRDIELETLAQTWSEHCKHTIFASSIDDVKAGIFKHFIKRATDDIRARRGNNDICLSVFKDNSGAIIFDDEWMLTDKMETHNSPSALDPFGGAITGIVGVNRDTLGFGMGAKPAINRYGFCLADPRSEPDYYRAPDKTNPMLKPATIMEGVVHGVNVGGNCSGIPTPQGFVYFDDRYCGKPLVFAGTVGVMPRTINGKPGHEKKARSGDHIVMVGGRVGKDGIHGATFSSVALDEGSPSTAVQIGDPITQKKFSDAIVREARDLGLYHAITDNGAGGLSSSVGEMAEDSGGFHIELEKVPLKYPGMAPWEIWISESQERMTLAIPSRNIERFIDLMGKRGVEATVIGQFTDDGRARVSYDGTELMNVSMDFLHDGLPDKHQAVQAPNLDLQEPELEDPQNYSALLTQMMGQLNICSKEFIATQYDHEVQASSILKPLQGPGRVCADATVSRPVLGSMKGAITSQGLAPRYSDIDTYHMAAASLDMAVRAAVSVGGNLDHMAIMDNFCWCDSTSPERLYQLKRAGQACYDVATAYGTPFISGKDSMFNDFKGYDADDQPVHIAVPPTLLASALGVLEHVEQAVSLDAKIPGDAIYILGNTRHELGASEYYHLHGGLGANVPELYLDETEPRYRAFFAAVRDGLVNSSIPVGFGGLGVALGKTLVAGQLGADVTLASIPRASDVTRDDTALFSESLGRLLVTVAPNHQQAFEARMQGTDFAQIGEVTEAPTLNLQGLGGQTLATVSISTLDDAYKTPLKGY